jgi:hypothetical protein
MPAFKSMRFARAYAILPESALQKTTASEIAVICSGVKLGYANINTGTNIKPPPAPIKVPSVPIAKPIRQSTKILSIV